MEGNRVRRGRRSSKNIVTSEAIGFVPNPWDTPRGVAEKNPSNPKTPENEEKGKIGARKERNESTAPDATHHNQSTGCKQVVSHSLTLP